MKAMTLIAGVFALAMVGGCSPGYGEPEPARIVHVYEEERWGELGDNTVIEFKDKTRAMRRGQWGHEGDEFMARRHKRFSSWR